MVGERASDAVALAPDLPSPPVGHAPAAGRLARRPVLAVTGKADARLAGHTPVAAARSRPSAERRVAQLRQQARLVAFHISVTLVRR